LFENEAKFRISEEKKIVRGLKALGATKFSEEKEVDVYLCSSYRDFQTTKEELRVRRLPEKCLVTYKCPRKRHGLLKTREELETSVGDRNIVLTIFRRLGFKQLVTVEKNRKIFRLKNALICLDQVKHLGEFLEVEILTSSETGDAERFTIKSIMVKLGLTRNDIESMDYWELALKQGASVQNKERRN
jgi:adenylate cyclase class 2